MFDRHHIGNRAILVHIFFSKNKEMEDLQEFQSLVSAAGVISLHIIIGNRQTPNPKYFIGNGKAQEIAEAVKSYQASLILFNHNLSPAQERNLERLCQSRVIDRIGLILDIFSQRARTHEGQLQVELAQLRHSSTRLVKGWTHLERQRGGIGLRGVGETQLESDRRLLRNRMNNVLSRLKKIVTRREQSRRSRKDIPTIALVGYTNTGKSTLFNHLTQASVYTADKMFATLDPMFRRINLRDVGNTIMVDTVGFIRHLPYNLIAAFKATLQETTQANLLLHIVDATDQYFENNINAVNQILTEIQADNIPRLLIMNKIDKHNQLSPRIDRDEQNRPVKIWISAIKGEGISLLIQAVTECLSKNIVRYELHLPPQSGRLRSYFYQIKAIENEWVEQDGSIRIFVKLPVSYWNSLCKKEKNLRTYLI
ncbi:ribosome rescue GTPase HflX [Candidatus Curculioniphilus buchneri]|uniref:ribosome rescue GTPase HflX n=1 Tax=Candidatus Curculioniphilus buchneri TaxID=690594 RepID=UPI00376EC1DE